MERVPLHPGTCLYLHQANSGHCPDWETRLLLEPCRSGYFRHAPGLWPLDTRTDQRSRVVL